MGAKGSRPSGRSTAITRPSHHSNNGHSHHRGEMKSHNPQQNRHKMENFHHADNGNKMNNLPKMNNHVERFSHEIPDPAQIPGLHQPPTMRPRQDMPMTTLTTEDFELLSQDQRKQHIKELQRQNTVTDAEMELRPDLINAAREFRIVERNSEPGKIFMDEEGVKKRQQRKKKFYHDVEPVPGTMTSNDINKLYMSFPMVRPQGRKGASPIVQLAGTALQRLPQFAQQLEIDEKVIKNILQHYVPFVRGTSPQIVVQNHNSGSLEIRNRDVQEQVAMTQNVVSSDKLSEDDYRQQQSSTTQSHQSSQSPSDKRNAS